MKKIFLFFAALLPFQLFADPFEVDGIYYDFVDGTAETAEWVNIVASPEGVYSGVFEAVPTIVYNGRTYQVNGSNFSSSIFSNSAITEFTLGKGWFDTERPSLTVHLINDKYLQKLTIKSFYDDSEVGFANSWINVGFAYDCVNVFVRQVSEDEYDLVVDKFEVYGPDGQRFTPFLGFDDYSGDKVYFDDNNTIRIKLDNGLAFTYNGRYCTCLKLGSGYYVIILGVEYKGKIMCVRTQPLHSNTGLYTKVDGVYYAIQYDFAEVCAPQNGDTYSGTVNIVPAVTYEGKTYPVTKIGANAFLNSDITSVVFPSSIISVGTSAFEKCSSLVSADMSACSSVNFENYTFYNCPALTDVNLPTEQEDLALSMFYNCSSLAQIEIPSTINKISYSFTGCSSLRQFTVNPGTTVNRPFNECHELLDIEIISDNEDEVAFKLNSNILDIDGNEIPLAAIPALNYYSNSYDPSHDVLISKVYYPDEAGVITMPKSSFTYTHPLSPYDERTATSIMVVYNSNAGDYLDGPVVGSAITGATFAELSIDRETQGIENINITEPSSENSEEFFYNLQGIRINSDALTPGIYIRRTNGKTSKVLVR